MTRIDTEQGSATVFGVAVVGLIATTGLMLAWVLAAVSARIETETAADAAALAAVAAAIEGRDPQPAAAGVAAANGAQLVRCRCPDFSGRTFSATVLVVRDVRMPLVGERRIEVERSAQFATDP